MHEGTTTVMWLDSKSMKTFMFGVCVAAATWLSVSTGPAGIQVEPQVAWSPNLNLKSISEIPKRLREPE
jgi:hypothetical protein